MLLHYITDRTQFPGGERSRRRALLEKIAEAVRCQVDFIQLREKDLPVGELELLAESCVRVICENLGPGAGQQEGRTRLLINSRTDVALACGADGVHLRADDIPPSEVHSLWARAGRSLSPVLGVSCHTLAEVRRAASEGATFAVFAPVFEKRGTPQSQVTGLDGLAEACRNNLPVLALGGVNLENAGSCLEAGAAGIAGIRLFQDNEIARVVQALRG